MDPIHTPQSEKKSNRFPEVTFKDFAQLAGRRALTAQDLAERFRGRIQEPLEFFSRVLSGKFPENLIPYRSALEFYFATLDEPSSGRRTCACGCRREVFDRKKWALPGCQKRNAREKVTDVRIRVQQVLDFVDARPGQNRRMATLPFTEQR